MKPLKVGIITLLFLVLVTGCSLKSPTSVKNDWFKSYSYLVPKNSKVIFRSNEASGKVLIVIMSRENIDHLRVFYRITAHKNGWFFENELPLKNGFLLVFSKGKWKMDVSISSGSRGNKVIITSQDGS
jgi:hypothetical protein